MIEDFKVYYKSGKSFKGKVGCFVRALFEPGFYAISAYRISNYLHKKLFRGESIEPYMVEYDASKPLRNLNFKNQKSKKLWIRSTGYPVKDKEGKLLEVVIFTENITEQKKSEEALRMSEEKFSKFFELSPHVMMVFDLETGERIAMNKAYEEVTGYKRKETKGKTLFETDIIIHRCSD